MIYLIAGQKGTGKSLATISFIMKKRKNYDYFFANFPVKNFIKIDHIDWVFSRFPENSVILIDEAQLYYNSREFSKLTKNGVGMQLLDYLTMCRHYKVDIFFITQSANRIDLQIRELADYVYHIKKTYKIPFLRIPFLVKGLQFLDIMEYEKYLNPNNFSTDCKSSWYFKLITKKDLKMYDTHFIEPTYLDKKLINMDTKY